jgi:hypothetical protein
MTMQDITALAFRYDFHREIGEKGDWTVTNERLPLKSRLFELRDAPGHKRLHNKDAEILGERGVHMVPWSSTIIAPLIVKIRPDGQEEFVDEAVVHWTEPDPSAPDGRKQRCVFLISSRLDPVAGRAALHRCIFQAIEWRLVQLRQGEFVQNLSTVIKAQRDPGVTDMERFQKPGSIQIRLDAFAATAEFDFLTGIPLFKESDIPHEAFFARILNGEMGKELSTNAPTAAVPTAIPAQIAAAPAQQKRSDEMKKPVPTSAYRSSDDHRETVERGRALWGRK